MFNLKLIDLEKDYDVIKEWWEAYGWPAVPKTHLPPLGAFVVNEDGEKLYSFFVYLTGTPMAGLEWILSNPFSEPNKKRGALQYGIETMSEIVKQYNVKNLFISTQNSGLVNSLKKCGFNITDTQCTNMIKHI